MGDITPDWSVERMQLERQKRQVELNVFDCRIRLREIEGERARLEENVEASHKALAELDERIAGIADQGDTDG